jgi:hypothetical protein
MRVLLTTRESALRARTRAICHLKHLVVNAPEDLRRGLQPLSTAALLERCAQLRWSTAVSVEQQYTMLALRSTARRALALETEAAELEAQLELLVKDADPEIHTNPGLTTIEASSKSRLA